MKIDCLSYKSWANAAGYRTFSIQTDSDKENLTDRYDFIENIKNAKKILLDQELESPVLIECTDVKVLLWNWEQNPDIHNYRSFFISSNNDLLIDDNVNSEVWLQYFPIFSKIDGEIFIEDSVLLPSEEIFFDSPPIIAIGHSQFAHFLSDHLSNFFVAAKAGVECNEFVVPQHTTYQNETLSALNFYRTSPKVHAINLNGRLYKMLSFNKLYIVANYGIRDRYTLIQELIGANFESLEKTNRMVYMLRGIQAGHKRVSNEIEVLDLCKKYSIEVVDGSKLSFKESAVLYQQFSTFISGPSAANTNFHLFSLEGSKLLYGLASTFQMPNGKATFGAAFYMLPKLNDTEIIISDMANSSFLEYHDPINFHIPLLEFLIQKRLSTI